MSASKGMPSIALVLGHGHAPEPEDEEHDPEQAKLDAATALIDAIKAGDAQAVVEAMGAMHDLCAAEYGDEDE